MEGQLVQFHKHWQCRAKAGPVEVNGEGLRPTMDIHRLKQTNKQSLSLWQMISSNFHVNSNRDRNVKKLCGLGKDLISKFSMNLDIIARSRE